MSSVADTMRKDGSLEFSGGQDAGRSPSIIQRNQVAAASNTSMRGGFLKPRPAWKKVSFEFVDTDVRTGFKTLGRFQHGSFFNGSDTPMLLSSHGGRLFKADLFSHRISEITPIVERSTATTSPFNVPAVGDTVAVSVITTNKLVPTTASGLSYSDVPIEIAGLEFELISVDSSTVATVQNNTLANVGILVPSDSSFTFSFPDTNSQSLWQGWSAQAENYWIYQDNQSLPIIFNGAVARRSSLALREVPVGNVMAYTMGRLIVSLPNRESFRIGDLVFGSSGSEANGYRDSVLRFTENDYLNEGGDFIARVFGAPSGYGPITAIKAISMMDTALGQGPCLVGTPNIIFTLNLPFDRTTWQASASPLQTVTPIVGPVGQNNVVNVNTDLWYRGSDASIHSLILARRDFTSWGNAPQSSELGKTLNYDTPWLLEHGSAVFVDNRRLETCSPVPSNRGVWHRGLVSMDFNLLASLRNRAAPAWEGIWSGLRILQLVSGRINSVEHCYAYVLNDSDEIEIWELDESLLEDNGTEPIVWAPTLCSYNFADGFNMKKLETGELFVDDVRGSVSIAIQYRSDQNPCWQDWDTFALCAKNEDCGPFACAGPSEYREQFRSKLKLHQPPDDFDAINKRKYRTGYEFQPRLEITGHCEIKQLRLLAFDEPESTLAERSVI